MVHTCVNPTPFLPHLWDPALPYCCDLLGAAPPPHPSPPLRPALPRRSDPYEVAKEILQSMCTTGSLPA